jgi:hypothetical protein
VLKGHTASGQGGSPWSSPQMRWFLRWSSRGGWSGRVVAQRRPRVSKLGLKGPSGYYSNGIEVEVARWEASGPNKRATITKYLFKERELDNSFNPNWIRAKGSLPEKNTAIRKELLTLSPGNVAEGSWWSWWRRWWVRTSWANHKSMWQCFGVLRVKRRKVSLNRQPGASTFWEGGGLGFSPNTSHMIWKWRVNTTFAISHQADPARCYKFHILQTNLQYTIFYNIILWLGKTTNRQDQFPMIHSTMWRNCVFILEHMVWVHANTGNALVALGIWLAALKNVYTGIITKLTALQHGCTLLCERRHCITKSIYRLRNVHT